MRDRGSALVGAANQLRLFSSALLAPLDPRHKMSEMRIALACTGRGLRVAKLDAAQKVYEACLALITFFHGVLVQ